MPTAGDGAEAERETALQEAFFWRLHGGLTQQGPGSDASTLRALALAAPVAEAPRILDLGCGPGRQTLALARASSGPVVAVDLIADFLAETDRRAAAAGLADRVTTRCASMAALAPPDFPDGGFDLVWSEGAIYNVGFEAGLRDWRRLLAPGGRVAVSELSWIAPRPPPPLAAYWRSGYPDMADVATNERRLEAAGYRLLDRFTLPEVDWWRDYYGPLEARLAALRQARDDPAWRRCVAEREQEIAVVREGLGAFGYVFYVMEAR